MQKICGLIILLIGIFITNITFAGGSHMFTFKSIDGEDTINLSDFSGKAVLVVNTASRCGFTSQYDGLQTLWEEYKDRGLVVLGVPSNDFGGQEPGTEKEIKNSINSVLDIGTGTGILSLTSSKLFNSTAMGIDIDAESISQANSNLLRNNSIKNTSFTKLELEEVTGSFDLIVANISKSYLVSKSEILLSRLLSNSYLLISGFIFSDFNEVKWNFFYKKCNLIRIIQINNWITLLLRKV